MSIPTLAAWHFLLQPPRPAAIRSQAGGFGWTLNFANIWAWLLVGLIIFVLIARLLNRGVKGRV